MTVHLLEFLPLFGGMQKNFILKKFRRKKKKLAGVLKKDLFLKILYMKVKFILKKNGIKNLRTIGNPVKIH